MSFKFNYSSFWQTFVGEASCFFRLRVFDVDLRSSHLSAMAKNRNKKKRSGAMSMDITENTVNELPQAMDVSESAVHKPASGAPNLKLKKRRPMKRSKNVRNTKAMAKAISKGEQTTEKILKNQSKIIRIQSAKTLYE